MNECTEFGLKQCWNCWNRAATSIAKEQYSCMVDNYRYFIARSSDETVKHYYMVHFSTTAKQSSFEYYFVNTLKLTFPDRFHIIEKYVILK